MIDQNSFRLELSPALRKFTGKLFPVNASVVICNVMLVLGNVVAARLRARVPFWGVVCGLMTLKVILALGSEVAPGIFARKGFFFGMGNKVGFQSFFKLCAEVTKATHKRSLRSRILSSSFLPMMSFFMTTYM